MHITNPDYTELGFIKANYQQFIDLPDINFNNTSFYIEETVQIDDARNNVSFFGNTEGNNSIEAWSNANSRGTYRYKGTNSYDFAAPKDEVHIYGFERDSDGHNKVYYDNTIGQPEVIRDFATAINTTDLHCRLFNNGTANSYFSGFIFHVYIEYQGNALYDLYPAKRNADEVTGLYDVLTDTFFSSTSGVDFIAGPDKAAINITATTIGSGSVSIPATTECYEFITIDATPGTDYVFGGYFNDNSELVTLSRSLTFFSGETDISFTVKFSDASTPVDTLTRTFSVYHSTGNTRTRQSDDVYISTTVVKFPRVLKSFSDKTGAVYGTIQQKSGFYIQNLVDNLAFNNYVANYTDLTTFIDSDNIREFFENGDNLITGAPNHKLFNLRLVDEISGYYVTIPLMQQNDYGMGYFYDNENNLIFSTQSMWSRDDRSNPVSYSTIGFQGFEDGDVTENSKLVMVQASKVTSQKNLLIESDSTGNVIGDPSLLNWFIGVKRGEIVDPTDPYDNMGNSSQNGGNGSFEFVFDFTPITELPERISAVSSGFVSLFQIPDTATMNSIAEFMNSPNWIQNLSKFFSEPADAIVSLHILPVELSGTEVTRTDVEGGGVPFTDAGGTKIQADKVNNQYYIKDLGFINVPEVWGSDLDYQPYTSAELYLPYISFVDIDVDEIMGKTLGLVYAIDLLSGDCMAFLSVDGDLKYQFAGNCASKIPYNSNSHNIITEAGAIVGGIATMIAGAVAGNPGIIAAGGGSAMGGLMSVVKKNYRHGSGVGGTHGFLSLQKPVLYLKRPNQNKPADYNKYKGHPSNITAYLGSLSGFTQVDSIHLENISATDEERSEITMLLKEGVLI